LQKFSKTMTKEKLTTEQEQLARFAKALGHPIRVAILQMLAKQTCCYHGDMSEILPVAKSTLSQHLSELKEAGLIQGTFTPPTVYYCINPKNWKLAKEMFNKIFIELSKTE
jgi:ArsR family transcriptional regulator